MRIAIDARLNAYRHGGIPQYTRQLLQALAEHAPNDRFISFQHREMLRPLVVAPNVARRTAFTPPHHRYEQWALPLEVALAHPDVLHCPDFIAPSRRTCAAVITIHDLAFLHYPQILDDTARSYYGQIKQSSARADGIIAVSESTRQDIAQLLDIPYEEIAVIHEAAAPVYTPIELRAGEVRVLGDVPVVAGSFMLFVSTLEPRKNVPTLLKALRLCVDRRPERAYQLVLVGGRGWRDEPIFDALRDLRLSDHVLLAGNAGQYDLRWLYNACRLYINPSLYEGFGLPLLEAMACGTPCIASAASSLPEVGGEAVQYVAPLDVEQWASAIEVLWDDDERRAELGRRGLARAQQFSWQRAARETLKVYEAAIARRGQEPGARSQNPKAESQATTAVRDDEHDAALVGRRCTRCGAAMVSTQAAELSVEIRGSSVWQADTPHTWHCPHCGYAELVIAHAPMVHAAELLLGAPSTPLHTSATDGHADTREHVRTSETRDGVDAELLPAAPSETLHTSATDGHADTREHVRATETRDGVDGQAPQLLLEIDHNGVPPTVPLLTTDGVAATPHNDHHDQTKHSHAKPAPAVRQPVRSARRKKS